MSAGPAQKRQPYRADFVLTNPNALHPFISVRIYSVFRQCLITQSSRIEMIALTLDSPSKSHLKIG